MHVLMRSDKNEGLRWKSWYHWKALDDEQGCKALSLVMLGALRFNGIYFIIFGPKMWKIFNF